MNQIVVNPTLPKSMHSFKPPLPLSTWIGSNQNLFDLCEFSIQVCSDQLIGSTQAWAWMPITFTHLGPMRGEPIYLSPIIMGIILKWCNSVIALLLIFPCQQRGIFSLNSMAYFLMMYCFFSKSSCFLESHDWSFTHIWLSFPPPFCSLQIFSPFCLKSRVSIATTNSNTIQESYLKQSD